MEVFGLVIKPTIIQLPFRVVPTAPAISQFQFTYVVFERVACAVDYAAVQLVICVVIQFSGFVNFGFAIATVMPFLQLRVAFCMHSIEQQQILFAFELEVN